MWTAARWCTSSCDQPFEIIHPCTDYGFKRVMQQPHICQEQSKSAPDGRVKVHH